VGTADSKDDNNNLDNATFKSDRTPFKSRWLVPLIKNAISETQNNPYKQLKIIISPFIKAKFLSDSLLQNAHCQAWLLKVFGNPDDNVQMVNALVAKMQSYNHDLVVVENNASEVYKMLEAMILTEEINKRKSAGEKINKVDKISLMKNWKVNNMQMLIDGGLDQVVQGSNVPKFVSGVFFLTSAARKTVPHLQQDF
jgi:hypothetical protein